MLTIVQIGAILSLLMAFEVPYATIQDVERTLMGTRTVVVQNIAPTVIDVVQVPTCTITADTSSTVNNNPYKAKIAWTATNTAGGKLYVVDSLGGLESHEIDGVRVYVTFKPVLHPLPETLLTATTTEVVWSKYYKLVFSDGATCYTKTK